MPSLNTSKVIISFWIFDYFSSSNRVRLPFTGHSQLPSTASRSDHSVHTYHSLSSSAQVPVCRDQSFDASLSSRQGQSFHSLSKSSTTQSKYAHHGAQLPRQGEPEDVGRRASSDSSGHNQPVAAQTPFSLAQTYPSFYRYVFKLSDFQLNLKC